MRPKIPLPRAWNRPAKSAILYILALSHYALTALDPRPSTLEADKIVHDPTPILGVKFP